MKFRIFDYLFVLMLFLVALFVVIASVSAINPLSTQAQSRFCEVLNLSFSECLNYWAYESALDQKLSNYSQILVVNQTLNQTYYIVNTTYFNQTINQTVFYNNTVFINETTQALLDHEYRMKQLELGKSNTEEKTYTQEELDAKIVEAVSAKTEPTYTPSVSNGEKPWYQDPVVWIVAFIVLFLGYKLFGMMKNKSLPSVSHKSYSGGDAPPSGEF